MPDPLILIADDEPLLIAALSREARRKGIRVISDTSSERVVDLAREYKPDLIVLDVRQHVDGRVLLGRLKRDPLTRDIKVVVFSGSADKLTREVCLGLGAVDYVAKPMEPDFIDRLLSLIKKAA